MAARVFQRTGADTVLANPELAQSHAANLDPAKHLYLAEAGQHIATLLEVDHRLGMQAAVALAPRLTQRAQYVQSVLGAERVDACLEVLQHIESRLDAKSRDRLYKEISSAMMPPPDV